VQAAALQGLTTLIRSIEKKANLKMFTSALSIMISKIVEMVKQDQLLGQTALANFIFMVEKHPTFIKSKLTEVVILFTEIVENANSNISSALRITAL
jgi:hypothetical protein